MNRVKSAQELKIPSNMISAENDSHVQQIIDNLDKYEKILKE